MSFSSRTRHWSSIGHSEVSLQIPPAGLGFTGQKTELIAWVSNLPECIDWLNYSSFCFSGHILSFYRYGLHCLCFVNTVLAVSKHLNPNYLVDYVLLEDWLVSITIFHSFTHNVTHFFFFSSACRIKILSSTRLFLANILYLFFLPRLTIFLHWTSSWEKTVNCQPT